MKVQDCQQTKYDIAAVGNIFTKPDPKEINCDILVLLGGMLPLDCDTEGKARKYLPDLANWINNLSVKEVLFIFSKVDKVIYNITETQEYIDFINSLNKPFINIKKEGLIRSINGEDYKLVGLDNISDNGHASSISDIVIDNEKYKKNQIIFSYEQAGLMTYQKNEKSWKTFICKRQTSIEGRFTYGGYAQGELIFRNAKLHFYGNDLVPKKEISYRYFKGNCNSTRTSIYLTPPGNENHHGYYCGRTRFKTINSVYLTNSGNKHEGCGIYHCNIK